MSRGDTYCGVVYCNYRCEISPAPAGVAFYFETFRRIILSVIFDWRKTRRLSQFLMSSSRDIQMHVRLSRSQPQRAGLSRAKKATGIDYMTKMVRIGAGLLVAGLAFSTLTGPAHAADLGGYERMPSIKDRAPEYRPSIWSGFYIGANIGGGAGTVSSKDASDNIGAGGAIGGVHGGYNWQRGNFVFGAEADFDVSGMRGSKTYSDGDVAAHFRNLGSIRGRLGYAFNKSFAIEGAANIVSLGSTGATGYLHSSSLYLTLTGSYRIPKIFAGN